MDDRFVTKEGAAFGVGDLAGVEEEDGVGVFSVDVQRASLMGVAEHLHHAGEIVVSEAAAEAGVRLREHLRGLEAVGFADDDLFYVTGDGAGSEFAVDVVVAASLVGFHQSALRAVAEGDDGHGGVFCVGADDAGDVESVHLAHVGGAEDGAGGVVLEGGEGEGGLRAGGDFEAFALQGVSETLGEIDVAVDEQNFSGAAGEDHERASSLDGCGVVSATTLRTSITLPSWEIQPETCGASSSPGAVISALMSSHSPVTGKAIHSDCDA